MELSAPSPTWMEHYDIVKILITLLFGVVTWGLIYYIKSQTDFNKTMTTEIGKIHDRITLFEKEFYYLKGSHEANHSGEK